MSRTKWLELLLVLLSMFLYVGYHGYLFWGRSAIQRLRKRNGKHEIVMSTAREARLVWTYVISQDKTDAGVPAVQTIRNSIMAASFMATTCGIMVTSGLLRVLTDPVVIRYTATLADVDPIAPDAGSHGIISVQWKVAADIFVLLMSFLFFLQAIRLWTFLGYFIRVTPSKENKHNRFPIEITLAISRRAGHCWSAGIRTFMAVIPMFLWLMGPTALFVTTIIVVGFLGMSDYIKVHDESSITGDPDKLYEEKLQLDRKAKTLKAEKLAARTARQDVESQ